MTRRKNAKRRNNDLQAIAQKTKDRATRIALKTEGELMCSESVSNSCTTWGTYLVIRENKICYKWVRMEGLVYCKMN